MFSDALKPNSEVWGLVKLLGHIVLLIELKGQFRKHYWGGGGGFSIFTSEIWAFLPLRIDKIWMLSPYIQTPHSKTYRLGSELFWMQQLKTVQP